MRGILILFSVTNSSKYLQSTTGQSIGFILGFIILIGIAAAILYTGFAIWRSFQAETSPAERSGWLNYATPLLAVLGTGVAAYMTLVETTSVQAICGPLGNCNIVQNSSYAHIFGVLPVGVLGMIGYLAILVTWLWGQYRSDRLSEYASMALFGMTFFGSLYSIYLTYLELYVIRAVCVWCLSSAVIITLLLLVNVSPMLQASFPAGEEDE
jgi:uncharacterized membrane protein